MNVVLFDNILAHEDWMRLFLRLFPGFGNFFGKIRTGMTEGTLPACSVLARLAAKGFVRYAG